jgi:phosphoenolpyruvate-protein phosphotransferase (PTS system enzyme I)
VVGLGGVNSHTAILARSLDKPAVVGLGERIYEITDDDWLIVDGDEGTVLINPSPEMLADYRERQNNERQRKQALRSLIGLAARSRDGVAIDLLCNIEMPREATDALDVGASGIGLFRSEFLFLNRNALPDEDEQFEAYRDAVLAMQGRPVTIRTLDVGADKALPGQHRQSQGNHSMVNPSLSQRAIRYCLAQPVLFLTQLRALLRASAYGPLNILLPMIAHPSEVEASKLFLARARAQLDEAKQKYADHVPVGAMIEVPAAAITADWFAHHLDFLSIGTNDLVQYTLAIDRDDPSVADLYDPWHPAVLSLINQTLEAGRRHGTSVTLCGEMAGQVEFTEVLLGLGLTSFSMHASSLLRVKEKLFSLDSRRAQVAAQEALSAMYS